MESSRLSCSDYRRTFGTKNSMNTSVKKGNNNDRILQVILLVYYQ